MNNFLLHVDYKFQLNFANTLKIHILNKLSQSKLNELGVFPKSNQLEKLKCIDLEQLILRYTNLQNKLLIGKKEVILCKSLLDNYKHNIYKDKIIEFKNRIEYGKSITEYLSDKIDDLFFDDYLLEDWNIHHLHFVKINRQKKNNSQRGDDILFLTEVVDNNIEKVYFINILTHKDVYKIYFFNIVIYHFS